MTNMQCPAALTGRPVVLDRVGPMQRLSAFWRWLVEPRVVVAVILLNALALVFRGFDENKDGADHALFWLEYGCTIYFLIELGIKIRLGGPRQFWASGWNKADVIIVLASTPILIEPFVDIPEDISLLLLLRIARIARLVRVLNFVPERDRLWQGVARALRAALGVAVTLLVYCFMLGLAACHLFHQIVPEAFGDPIISLYSMFKVFTIEGWYEIPDQVAESAPTAWVVFIRLFFMGSVVTGGILGLSLANAIFVDQMVMDNTDEAEHQLAELKAEICELRSQVAANHAQLLALLSAKDLQARASE